MRLIDADALMDRTRYKKSGVSDKNFTEGFNDAVGRFRSMLHSAPTIEAEPVRHGRWKYVSAPVTRSSLVSGYLTCSECGAVFVRHVGERWKGCPSCLTRMYEEEE